MSYTSQLKAQVDLPTWEWCRFSPVITASLSCMTTANNLNNRFIYHANAAAFYRYDTYNDSWQQLTSPIILLATMVELNYSSYVGTYRRAISATLNTIESGGLYGNVLVGRTIRILSGTGAGQERIITAVSDPIVKDRGIVTTTSTASVLDATTGAGTKQWKINQYRDHQVRIDYGNTGGNVTRNILYNNYNTLTFYDVNYSTVTPWWGGILPVTLTANSALYQIESNILTVDQNWTITPDNTSQFVILTGGLWAFSSATTGAFFTLQYYDEICDTWYQKSIQTGNTLAAWAGDIASERYTEIGGAIATGTATSGTSRTLVDSTATMIKDQYANFELRITGGTGIGQTRSILANSATTFVLIKDFAIAPDNTSTYSIYRNTSKLTLIGNNSSCIYEYDINADQITPGKIYDYGVARSFSFAMGSLNSLGITSITRLTNGITALNATPTAGGSGYSIDNILTITTGGTLGTARVTDIDASGAVVSVQLEMCGSGYTTGTGKATTVTPAGGTGCTLNITSIGDIANLTPVIAHNIKIGDTITVSGAIQTDYNGSKTVLGTNTSAIIQYAVSNSPTTPATFTTHSTTTLIDLDKSWTTNEHVGKIVQISGTPSNNPISQTRIILSNTSTTLTFAAATASVNGTSRYAIFDSKAFSVQKSIGTIIGGGRSDYATSGSTTTLVDSTKTWPKNYWTGKKVRIIAGTGLGNADIVITSNTATTLTYATQTFTPDTTTIYMILDCFGVATGGSTTTLIDTTQNWATNVFIGKRVKLIAGTGAGNEYTITANTATTLTFAVATAPDTTTAYAIFELPARSTGIHLDCINGCSNSSLNNKYLYMWKGGATSDLYRYNFNTEQSDIVSYYPASETLTTGSMYVYDGVDRIYYTKDATGRVYYYDIVKNVTVPFGMIPYGMSTAILGNRMEIISTTDGLKYLYIMRHSGTEMFRTLIFN